MLKDTEHYSKTYVQILNRWLWPILSFVFRIEVMGLEHIKRQKSLLVANHNSGALIESHSLLFLLFQQGIRVFGLNHQALFYIPFVGKHFRKIGAISATQEQADQVLDQEEPLLVFPGGNRQAFRPYSQRHQHSFPWAKGWAKIAVDHQVPVVPIKFSGTHEINPILFTSKSLSYLLILPRLLKVTWFPVSLAQTLFALITFFLVQSLNLQISIAYLAAYLSFCLTPLVPVLPTKIKIKIYPPLQPKKDYVSAEDLIAKMHTLMDKPDMPTGTRFVYPLNGLETFILAHESKDIHYNSQFVFEFEGPVDKQYLLKITDEWIYQVPYLRSCVETSFLFPRRFVYDKPWFSSA